jgi:hypothetical protein
MCFTGVLLNVPAYTRSYTQVFRFAGKMKDTKNISCHNKDNQSPSL